MPAAGKEREPMAGHESTSSSTPNQSGLPMLIIPLKTCSKCEHLVKNDSLHSTLAYSRCRCHRTWKYSMPEEIPTRNRCYSAAVHTLRSRMKQSNLFTNPVKPASVPTATLIKRYHMTKKPSHLPPLSDNISTQCTKTISMDNSDIKIKSSNSLTHDTTTRSPKRHVSVKTTSSHLSSTHSLPQQQQQQQQQKQKHQQKPWQQQQGQLQHQQQTQGGLQQLLSCHSNKSPQIKSSPKRDSVIPNVSGQFSSVASSIPKLPQITRYDYYITIIIIISFSLFLQYISFTNYPR